MAKSAKTAPPMPALLFSSHAFSSHRYPNKLPLYAVTFPVEFWGALAVAGTGAPWGLGVVYLQGGGGGEARGETAVLVGGENGCKTPRPCRWQEVMA